MTTPKEAALSVLDGFADPALIQRADEAVAAHTHVWVWDPQVDHVVGLIRKNTNRADIIVYVEDDDFEVSDDWD